MNNKTPLDDLLLIQEFKGGNHQAMKHIFHLFWKSQCFFAKSFVQDYLIAEDIVAAVFVKLWDRRANFDALPSVKSFLFVATRNACFDYLKQDKRLENNKKAYAHTIDECFYDVDLAEVTKAEMMSKISNAIEALPSQYRKVMQLAAEGMNTVGIAKEMNMSPKIVRNYRARAINILKRDLSDKAYLLLLSICVTEAVLRA